MVFKKGHKRFGKGMLGKKQTDYQKRRMSETMKGKPSWNKGLKMSKKYCEKLSEIRKGEKNNNWRGGKSFEPYSKDFNKQLKKLIKIRDNYKCQLCGINDKNCKQGLCIHHINYNKKDCNINNLICLCHKCHSKTNGNREYWYGYFQGYLK